MMSGSFRVAHLSDTHFLEDGAEPEGGHSYDIDAAFAAVRDHLLAGPHVDLIVVTGDVADHGRAAQYRRAAAAFAELGAPVNVCPGNHDLAEPFGVAIGRPTVATSRVIELGGWAFLFVDTSAGVMRPNGDGLLVDPPGDVRLHGNGSLGAGEAAWVRRAHAATAAEHVFVWLHHPPAPPLPLCRDDAYEAEWRELVDDLHRVRGFGGGHTHVPAEYEFGGRPVYVAPSLKNNFAIEERTWLPPGYRTYTFEPDGTVTGDLHLLDDERWPRRPYGRALASLFAGELTHEQLREIVARRGAS